MRTRPRNSGCRSRNRPNARKPRTMFFDGSVRSTRRTMSSGRAATSARSRSSTTSSFASASNSSASIPIGWLVTRVSRPAWRTTSPSTSAPRTSAHERRKLRLHRRVWNPTTSFARRHACTSRRDVVGKHRPRARVRPRHVDEVRAQEIRPLASHHARCEVQVVVLEQHRGLRFAIELRDRGRRERLVHRHVSRRPGVVPRVVEVRRVREIPQRVLDEPQRRVGGDGVEALVRGGVVLDEMEPVRRSVARLLLERCAAVLARDFAVLVAHRARDPRHVVTGEEVAQRGREPAAAATRDARAARVARVRDRAAVGDDDQLPAAGHAAKRTPRC